MNDRKSYRVGERNISRQGLTMEIVKYTNNKNVEIVFLETGERKVVRYTNFLHGTVGANLADYPYKVVSKAKRFVHWLKIALAFIAGAIATIAIIKLFL